jgi:hypothetical protein
VRLRGSNNALYDRVYQAVRRRRLLADTHLPIGWFPFAKELDVSTYVLICCQSGLLIPYHNRVC